MTGIHTTPVITSDSLGGALMLRNGVSLEQRAWQQSANAPHWLQRNINDDLRQRTTELAHLHQHMSLVDICRAACRLDGLTVPVGRLDAIRAAMSSSSLSGIFTSNVSAELLSGYSDQADSTMGWVRDSDVNDFRENERATMGKMGGLKKHNRGGTAEDLDTSDSVETFKIARYSGKFSVDEQDIIDDRFGALDEQSPMEMGQSARQLRPDLVYAILLANPALQADGVAIFHADHNNLRTGAATALSAAAIEAAISQMGTQRNRNRPINVAAAFMLVPVELQFLADTILNSAERREAGTADGVNNPLQAVNITRVVDDRLGAAGVIDPDTETSYAGSSTQWFLTAAPGVNGAKTIEVAYLRGSGRGPTIRGYQLEQGQWGLGWDIKLDIGAKALDFRGMQRNDGQ